MNELESFIKRHNISEKDVYLLSKLESLKKIETSKNIKKITLKQDAILKNYSLTEPEKIKLFEMLENSIFHQIKENVIKYRDFENEILLESASNKTNKKKIIIFISVFFGVLVLFNLVGNNNNSSYNNSQKVQNSQNCNQSNHEMFVKNRFINTGKTVTGIRIEQTFDCGYLFLVEGMDFEHGLGFDCYVTTDSSSGEIQIINSQCETL